MVPIEGTHQPIPFAHTEFDEFLGAFSPDGRWIGYTSDETGRQEVYIQAFSGQTLQPSGVKLQVSTTGGSRIHWRRDGREVFYVNQDGDLMSVPLKAEGALTIGVPKKLFNTGLENPTSTTDAGGYAVAADGQRFLISVSLREKNPAPLTVVLNWAGGLKH